jgi:D-beta-D-heptose 7-phosphate kinase/D-beta-D-heptose 1-phosphate adenosyltransferase
MESKRTDILFEISLVSGGFDPLHRGHIDYFRKAARHGKILVLLNSDAWLTKKKGRPFMPWEDRAAIVSNMRSVWEVIPFDDSGGNAIEGIKKALNAYPPPRYRLNFLNGGDRTENNVPEIGWCEEHNVRCIFNVGGGKVQSSSWILKDWETFPVKRDWGEWRVLKDYPPTSKVKELIVQPGEKLSYQRHFHRNEFWHVVKGTGVLYGEHDPKPLETGERYFIKKGDWHQLANEGKELLQIVELQYGALCEESDIERKVV